MNKIACFDLDGVTVAAHEPFSQRLVRRQGLEIKPAVDEYFSRYFKSVMLGSTALGDSLEPYLSQFKWKGTTVTLMDFWFNGEKDIQAPVLQLVTEVRASGIPTYLVTDNPKERTDQLWKEGLDQYFDGKYVSGETGLKKSTSVLWEYIAKELNVVSSDIFFTDDDLENVEVARAAGVKAEFFTNTRDLRQQLQSFGAEV